MARFEAHNDVSVFKPIYQTEYVIDWLKSLKQVFINVSYHITIASLTLMALFKTEPSELD